MWPIFVVNGPNQKQVSLIMVRAFMSIAIRMRLHENHKVNKNP